MFDSLKNKMKVDWPEQRGAVEPEEASSAPKAGIPRSRRMKFLHETNEGQSLDADTIPKLIERPMPFSVNLL